MPEATTRTLRPSRRPDRALGAVLTARSASASPLTARPTQPDGWVKKSNKWVCLRCQRERVMDMAASGAGADGWASRREALMEFELLRTPDESDVVIAKRANCSTATCARRARA